MATQTGALTINFAKHVRLCRARMTLGGVMRSGHGEVLLIVWLIWTAIKGIRSRGQTRPAAAAEVATAGVVA